jgi:hypothetical protein
MLSQLISGHHKLQKPTLELPFKKFRIVLIKPSKYDDDGYVIRFWQGVLPSNTLNVLHGLTEEVKRSGVFGALSIDIITFDETAEKLPVKKIIGWSRHRSTKLVVGLVGVGEMPDFPSQVRRLEQSRSLLPRAAAKFLDQDDRTIKKYQYVEDRSRETRRQLDQRFLSHHIFCL